MAWMILALAIFVSGAGVAHKLDSWYQASKENAQLQAAIAAQAAAEKRADEIANRFEGKLTGLRAAFGKTQRDITDELKKRVYTDCVLPESGRLLRDHAIDDANNSLGFAPELPANPQKPKPGNDGRSLPAGSAADPAIRGVRIPASISAGTGQLQPATGPIESAKHSTVAK